MTSTAPPSPTPAPRSECAIRVDALSVRYGPRTALHDVSFAAGWGELIAVVGPNGAGKSTLCKAITRLVPCTGTVELAGRACHHHPDGSRAAYLPQRTDVDLAFPITVGQLVLSGRRPFLAPWRRPRPHDRRVVDAALDEVGLADRVRDPIGALSGGQLQRAFVARALAQEAQVLLLDESLAGVDRQSTIELVDIFTRLARSGRTVLVATHDLALTRHHFARCLAINGTLVADGPPDRALDATSLDATFGSGPLPHPRRPEAVAVA